MTLRHSRRPLKVGQEVIVGYKEHGVVESISFEIIHLFNKCDKAMGRMATIRTDDNNLWMVPVRGSDIIFID